MAAAGQYQKSSITRAAAYAAPFILNGIPYLLGLSSLPMALTYTVLSFSALLISEHLPAIQKLISERLFEGRQIYNMKLIEQGKLIALTFEGTTNLIAEEAFASIERKLESSGYYNPDSQTISLIIHGAKILRDRRSLSKSLYNKELGKQSDIHVVIQKKEPPCRV